MMGVNQTVWIAEKPSAAKDLVAGMRLAYNLNCTNLKDAGRDGFFVMDNGDIVLPLAGHLLSTARVSEYLSPEMAKLEQERVFDRYKDFLPVLPSRLITHPRTEEKKGAKRGSGSGKPIGPYTVAKRFLRKGVRVINAGDTDREGQLIVDELLDHFGIDPSGPNVQRVDLVSNRAEDIARILKQPYDMNGSLKWALRRLAAEVRQHLDFVWGLNLSITHQALLKKSNVAVGRVQTAVLEMVDARRRAIENFVVTEYYVPVITLRDGTVMRWYERPEAAGTPGFDLEGRIIDLNVANQIVRAITGGLKGVCIQATAKDHSEKPPLPFSLGALQSEAARQHGMTLDEVTEAAQKLYKHKAISYVGTDCRYLPESMHQDARNIMAQLAKLFPGQAQGAHMQLQSGAYSDAKMAGNEHFAIVPMGLPPVGASPQEQAVFRTIAKRFMAQFYPDYQYRKHSLIGEFGQDQFRATQREEVQRGWKEVESDAETSGEAEGGADGSADIHGEVERVRG